MVKSIKILTDQIGCVKSFDYFKRYRNKLGKILDMY